jgi:hypothetical protein
MNAIGWLQIAAYCAALALLAKPLGAYLARVFDGRACGLDRVLGPVERFFYRVCRTAPGTEMSWRGYAVAMLLFNAIGFVVVYGLQRLQDALPGNPMGMAAVTPHSSFNTAISFVTNTNWQGYGGEATMSYLTQMLALTATVERVSRAGATPLVVAEGARALGVVELRDIVKGGIRERFVELRRMGIKTVMITGDNPLTAGAIAAESGVDDFLAEATPEAKLAQANPAVRVHLTHLRRKLSPDPRAPSLIETLPGVGYRLRVDERP